MSSISAERHDLSGARGRHWGGHLCSVVIRQARFGNVEEISEIINRLSSLIYKRV